jgi:hypothetical protein
MKVYWQTLILTVLNLLVLLPEVSCTGFLGCPLFTGCMPQRDILWYLVFTGFAVNYVYRLNINIGIVSMVKGRAPKLDNISHSSVCIQSQTPLSSYNISTNITTTALHLPDEVSW